MNDRQKQTNKQKQQYLFGSKVLHSNCEWGKPPREFEREREGKGEIFRTKCLNANNGVKTIGDDNRRKGEMCLKKKNILSIF